VLASLAVLGLVCTATALSLYFYLIARIGAARAAVITYVNPAVAASLGVVFLHESFSAGSVLGLVLILTGSWLATHGPRAPHPQGYAATSSIEEERS
jgi:drug/metabolite transporter (DMT)-like permease